MIRSSRIWLSKTTRPLIKSSTTVCPSCGALKRSAASPLGFSRPRFRQRPSYLGDCPFASASFRLRIKFLRRTDAPVGVPLLEEPQRVIAIEVHPLSLPKRTFVPIEIDPAHAVKNGLNGIVGGAALIRVFDAEDEDPVLLPRKQPIEQGRPHPADMEVAGRTGRKSNPDLTHRVTVALVEYCERGAIYNMALE